MDEKFFTKERPEGSWPFHEIVSKYKDRNPQPVSRHFPSFATKAKNTGSKVTNFTNFLHG